MSENSKLCKRLQRLEQDVEPYPRCLVLYPGQPEPENIDDFDEVLRIEIRPAVRPDLVTITRGEAAHDAQI